MTVRWPWEFTILHPFLIWSLQPSGVSTFIPILQVRKNVRAREVKWLTQGHTLSWDFSPDLPAFEVKWSKRLQFEVPSCIPTESRAVPSTLLVLESRELGVEWASSKKVIPLWNSSREALTESQSPLALVTLGLGRFCYSLTSRWDHVTSKVKF